MRRALRWALVPIALTLALGPTVAATAASDSWSGKTGCLSSDRKMKAATTITATDAGARVNIGSSSAIVYLQNCAENASRYGTLTLTWTISAEGFGITGCSVGGGFSCGGSTFTRTMTLTETASNTSRVNASVASGAGLYFKDTLGDTQRVCSSVVGKLGSTTLLTVEGCVGV